MKVEGTGGERKGDFTYKFNTEIVLSYVQIKAFEKQGNILIITYNKGHRGHFS
jgi:hypothetical protein